MADWFAVTALFHRVPIPVLERHTAIVVRKRQRLATALADLVQHRWLSRRAIAARLASLAPAGALLDWLAAPARRERLADAARDAAADLAAGLDRASLTRAVAAALRAHLERLDPAATLGAWLSAALARGAQSGAWKAATEGLAAALEAPAARLATAAILRDALALWLPQALEDACAGPFPERAAGALRRVLATLDFARPLGAWIQQTLSRGEHHRLAAALCQGLRSELAASDGLRRTIARTAATAASRYASSGWGRGALRKWLEWTGTLDYDSLAGEVASALDRELALAAEDPGHPLRRELDRSIDAWAGRLAAGDPAAVAAVEDLRRRLLVGLDLAGLVRTLLTGLAADLRDHAGRRTRTLMALRAGSPVAAGAPMTPGAPMMSLGSGEAAAGFPPGTAGTGAGNGPGAPAALAGTGALQSPAAPPAGSAAAAAAAAETSGAHPYLGLLDLPAMAEALLSALSKALRAAADNPDHPLRREGDAALADLAQRLTAGEPTVSAAAADLVRRLLAAIDLDAALAPVVAGVQTAAAKALRDGDSTPSRHLTAALSQALDAIKGDAVQRSRLDRRLRLELRGLVARHHDLIGEVVRASLSPERLPDAALVAELENQVGDDLQYIRLNGAIVGALVGALIAVVKQVV
jgi:uncharacterized membrane-anchored protein YjiN (DUF445 family)